MASKPKGRESVKVTDQNRAELNTDVEAAQQPLTQATGGVDPNASEFAGRDQSGFQHPSTVEVQAEADVIESNKATAGNDGGQLHGAGTGLSPAYRAPDAPQAALVDAALAPTEQPASRDSESDQRLRAELNNVPVVAHTPVLPLGQHQTSDPAMAQPVTMYPAQPGGVPLQPASAEDARELARAAAEGRSATIQVAAPAPDASMRSVAGQLEVAAPAPVPHPGDTDLTAGTVNAFQREGNEGEQEPR